MTAVTFKRYVRGMAAAALLASGALVLDAQVADSPEITAAFSDIKTHAVLAEGDAELLDSYTRSRLAWESHSRRISQMKEHVNDLIRDYQKVDKLRLEGSEWQQDVIDRMQPLIKGMSDHLSAAIDHLNQNQGRVHMKPWQDYVRANYEYAQRTANLIRDVVDYGEAKQKADSLEQHLGLPPATGE